MDGLIARLMDTLKEEFMEALIALVDKLVVYRLWKDELVEWISGWRMVY